MEGDEAANADLEKWSAVVENHPELKARNEKAAAEWAATNEGPNQVPTLVVFGRAVLLLC